MRLLTTLNNQHDDETLITMKVYKNTEWNEYVVKPFVNGICASEVTWYYCDDKEDANDTAAYMLNSFLSI